MIYVTYIAVKPQLCSLRFTCVSFSCVIKNFIQTVQRQLVLEKLKYMRKDSAFPFLKLSKGLRGKKVDKKLKSIMGLEVKPQIRSGQKIIGRKKFRCAGHCSKV